MRAFLQNFPRAYDNSTEQNILMNPQDVASLQECVGERAKNARGKGGRNKSPCCVSWAGETQALSCEKTRQGPTPHHAKAKPHGQTTWTKDTKDTRKCSCGQKIWEKQG